MSQSLLPAKRKASSAAAPSTEKAKEKQAKRDDETKEQRRARKQEDKRKLAQFDQMQLDLAERDALIVKQMQEIKQQPKFTPPVCTLCQSESILCASTCIIRHPICVDCIHTSANAARKFEGLRYERVGTQKTHCVNGTCAGQAGNLTTFGNYTPLLDRSEANIAAVAFYAAAQVAAGKGNPLDCPYKAVCGYTGNDAVLLFVHAIRCRAFPVQCSHCPPVADQAVLFPPSDVPMPSSKWDADLWIMARHSAHTATSCTKPVHCAQCKTNMPIHRKIFHDNYHAAWLSRETLRQLIAQHSNIPMRFVIDVTSEDVSLLAMSRPTADSSMTTPLLNRHLAYTAAYESTLVTWSGFYRTYPAADRDAKTTALLEKIARVPRRKGCPLLSFHPQPPAEVKEVAAAPAAASAAQEWLPNTQPPVLQQGTRVDRVFVSADMENMIADFRLPSGVSIQPMGFVGCDGYLASDARVLWDHEAYERHIVHCVWYRSPAGGYYLVCTDMQIHSYNYDRETNLFTDLEDASRIAIRGFMEPDGSLRGDGEASLHVVAGYAFPLGPRGQDITFVRRGEYVYATETGHEHN